MADPAASLRALGWDAEWQRTLSESTLDGTPGRVIRHDGVKVLVADGYQQIHATFPRDSGVAVGDWVVIDEETVRGVLDRRTVLVRDRGELGEQALAANVDLTVVVFGLDKTLRRSKVLRFVAFAWDIGAPPVVVLTKADLIDDPTPVIDEIRSWEIDEPVIPVSVEDGRGLDQIRGMLEGHTATLVGESGAGKSSLVNQLMGDEVAWTGEVRASDRRGRHTTTHRELHVLPTGGLVIDNPGIRSLGLAADTDGLGDAFDEIVSRASGCRFRDCSHGAEPGCAVIEAVESGTIDADRLEAFRRLSAEQIDAARRTSDAARIARRKDDAKAAREAREREDPFA